MKIALVHISLTIWISNYLFVAHIVKIRMNSLSVFFRDGSSSSYFWESCSNSEIVWLLWSFGLQPWCTGSTLFKEANFSPINEGSCWNLTLQVLLSLTIWISDCLSLAHIVNIRMNLLSVLLRDGSLSSYFLWKLFEIWAYANSLVYLECSHGTLAVFIIFFYFGKQISFPINEVTCWTLCLC